MLSLADCRRKSTPNGTYVFTFGGARRRIVGSMLRFFALRAGPIHLAQFSRQEVIAARRELLEAGSCHRV